jgi:hypothetical protein
MKSTVPTPNQTYDEGKRFDKEPFFDMTETNHGFGTVL